MLTVKLSDKQCVFCQEKQDTVSVKSKEHDFAATVCAKHMIGLLKKWEGTNAAPENSGSRGAA